MASISTDPQGNRTIQFVAGDRKRRSIRLGKIDMRTTREVAARIDSLNVARITGTQIDRDLAEWLTKVSDALYAKLEAVGLVDSRASAKSVPSLGEFAADFLGKRDGSANGTLLSINTAANRLIEHFGADAPIDCITPGMADDWLLWMTTMKKYSTATISRTVKHAKRIFRSAERLGIIKESPFADLRAKKQTNDSRKFFVSQATAYAVLDVLPDADWRLIFALSRFGGLRCPSEHLQLDWKDIDWERDRFRVKSPKTGERWVPIFAELRPYLTASFEAASDGAVHVIVKRRGSAQRWGVLLERILAKAGIERWPKIFHNLRASRQTELTARFSIGTVCRWLGNSIDIADAHYLTALDAEFEEAARALQNPVQQSEEKRQKVTTTQMADMQETAKNVENTGKHPGACKSQGDKEQLAFFLEKSRFVGMALPNPVQLPPDRDQLRLTIAAFLAGDIE